MLLVHGEFQEDFLIKRSQLAYLHITIKNTLLRRWKSLSWHDLKYKKWIQTLQEYYCFTGFLLLHRHLDRGSCNKNNARKGFKSSCRIFLSHWFSYYYGLEEALTKVNIIRPTRLYWCSTEMHWCRKLNRNWQNQTAGESCHQREEIHSHKHRKRYHSFCYLRWIVWPLSTPSKSCIWKNLTLLHINMLNNNELQHILLVCSIAKRV